MVSKAMQAVASHIRLRYISIHLKISDAEVICHVAFFKMKLFVGN